MLDFQIIMKIEKFQITGLLLTFKFGALVLVGVLIFEIQPQCSRANGAEMLDFEIIVKITKFLGGP